MPSMLFSPVLSWIFAVAWAAGWCGSLIVLAATDTVSEQENYALGQGHVDYEERVEYQQFMWYFIFFGFWVFAFIEACTELTLAICVTTWFKTQEKPPRFMYFRAVHRVFWHHLGTVACGSLIIAICQLIQAIIIYIKKKAEKAGVDNGLVKYVLACMSCFLWCLEKCLKFINRNAYIETALYGYSFCNAAYRAFNTLLHNIIQVGAVNFVGKIIFFTFKLLVIGGVCTGSYYWMEEVHNNSGAIPMYGAPLLIIGFISYFIAGAFTELFEMTADTLLICFCEDKSRNNGKDKPYLSSPKLLSNVSRWEKKSKKGKDDEDPEVMEMSATDKMH